MATLNVGIRIGNVLSFTRARSSLNGTLSLYTVPANAYAQAVVHSVWWSGNAYRGYVGLGAAHAGGQMVAIVSEGVNYNPRVSALVNLGLAYQPSSGDGYASTPIFLSAGQIIVAFGDGTGQLGYSVSVVEFRNTI